MDITLHKLDEIIQLLEEVKALLQPGTQVRVDYVYPAPPDKYGTFVYPDYSGYGYRYVYPYDETETVPQPEIEFCPNCGTPLG